MELQVPNYLLLYSTMLQLCPIIYLTLPRFCGIMGDQMEMGEPMKLYNCVSAGHPGAFIVTKFDENMEVESSYLVSNGECACPRGSAHSCRHRDMLQRFRQHKHIGDGWFLDWDTRMFHNIAITQTVADELEARDETLPETPVVEKDAPAVDLPSANAPQVSHPTRVATTGAPLTRRLIRR